MKLLRRYIQDTSGVTALEFAMVAPVLFALILGILEYGIIFHIQSLAILAGNEAARLGKTGQLYGDATTRRQVVKLEVERVMGAWVRKGTKLTVTTKNFGNFDDVPLGGGTEGPGGKGQIVLYTVSYGWKSLVPGLSQLIGDDKGFIQIEARALVKNEDF